MVIHQNPLRQFIVYQPSGRKKHFISVVAYFDRHGILNDYVVLDKTLTVDWPRLIFQTISLKLFMGSFLNLEGFQQVTIRGDHFKSVVTRTHQGYRAVIYEQPAVGTLEAEVTWDEYILPLVNSQ